MEGFGPGSEFGFKNLLRFFGLLPATPKTDPNKVRHTLGLGYPAPLHPKNPLPFFGLLPRSSALPAPHNRQVEGLGGPVKSFWAHHMPLFFMNFL